ncbi:hypothetical protein DL768_000804 [Monosporascus sp. mg162]|nr:hypothetical protein DL768_000804 [Monosporascus sp. mg162]
MPDPEYLVQKLEAGAVHKTLTDYGVVIIEGFLSPEQVAKLNGDVDPRLAALRQEGKTAKPPTQVSPSPWIPDLPQARASPSHWMADLVPPQVKWVHNLVDFSKVFCHEILNHELLHDVRRMAFEESGDYWLAYDAVIESGPGTQEQVWHRDWPNYASPKAGAGTTEAEMDKPDAEHPAVLSELKSGDSAVLSGKMVHRGSVNATQYSHRQALALVIIPGILTPLDATRRLPQRMVKAMTPLAQRMVGR